MYFVSRRIFLAASLSLPAATVQAAPPTAAPAVGGGLVTIVDGEVFLLRDNGRFALAEGVVLKADDILEVPEKAALARIELPDGTSLALGPGSRALLAPRIPGERAGARLYLLAGWLKIVAPAGKTVSVLSPVVDVLTTGGTVVVSVMADATRVVPESGEAVVRRRATPPQPVKAGEMYSRARGTASKPSIEKRPPADFIASLPRAFLDALPSRAARFQDRTVEPRRLGDIAYADAQPWIDGEPALRRAYLPRWRPLAADPEFRRGIAAGMSAHPEWAPPR